MTRTPSPEGVLFVCQLSRGSFENRLGPGGYRIRVITEYQSLPTTKVAID